MSQSCQTSQRPMISVILAVYEPHPEYFRKAIESILEQRFTDWELIIVEDPSPCSAVDTLRWISDPRIRHIANTQRTCLVEQKNRGLQEARGQFIAIMDADDIAHPFRFVKQINFLLSHPDVDVLGSHIGVIDTDDRIAGYRWYPCLHDEIQRAITRIIPIGHPTVMLRRKVIDQFGGYQFVEFPAAEDYEYWSRLIQLGVRFANLPEVLYYYRIHPAQSKLSKLRDTIRAVLRVKEIYWSDRFDLRARLQFWGEHVLLYLPQRLVAWMLLRGRWHYRSRSTAPHIHQLDSSFSAIEENV